MGHIKDTISYSAGYSTTHGCYVIGKPVILGGIPGRREATGRGVMLSVLEALKVSGMKTENTTAVVQGFGNVGSVAAQQLALAGCRVIGVSDINGGIYNKNGLDIEALTLYSKETGGINGFPDAVDISGSDLLELECEVLVPAAAANQITAGNADRIKALIIAEGANGPVKCDADLMLEKRGKFVIPDILCNAGGVFVSYLEYTQETQQEQMTEEEVISRLKKRMTEKFHSVYKYACANNISMRKAAMLMAVKTVCQARIAKGYLP